MGAPAYSSNVRSNTVCYMSFGPFLPKGCVVGPRPSAFRLYRDVATGTDDAKRMGLTLKFSREADQDVENELVVITGGAIAVMPGLT